MKNIVLIIGLITSLFGSIEKNILFNNDYNKINYGNSNYSNRCVHSSKNKLMLLQCETDNGPLATINLKNINLENPIIIEREVYIHPEYSRSYQGGDIFFTGALNLLQGKNKLFNISYFKYEYQCNCDFFWINNKNNKTNSIWNKWFVEKIIYYPGNGKLQYFINKESKLLINAKIIKNNKNLKLTMHTYGWWTGHYTKIKNLKIYQINIHKYYKDIKQKHTIKSYKNFINTYPYAPQVKDAINNIHKLAFEKAKEIDTISSYVNFLDNYPTALQKEEAIKNIYKFTKKQNNISGYEWFILKYSNAIQVKDAINNIHNLAFKKAKEIDTISAYNTFIISYPTASQVKEANNHAYEKEVEKYTNLGMFVFFNSEDKLEKKARKLLIKAKQIERYPANNDIENRQAGYLIIANRMYRLLQDKFDDTDATLRYLESEEFKDFVKSFKTIMNEIKYILRQIENNTSNSNKYIKELVNISAKGFEDIKADRAMTEYYTKQHREWEKYMHLRDKGYK